MGVFHYLKCGCRYLFDNNYRILFKAGMGAYNHISDDIFLKKIYKVKTGEELNLEAPKTFGEKLQWLKLYDRNPAYTMMVDKYEVRQYVAEKLGEEHLIPLLGVWDNPDEIDFDSLPNQFAIKCNHNSGLGMCICTDKRKLNIKKVKDGLQRGLKQDYYLTGREWPYKNVKRRIIAEKYMSDGTGADLRDYKFYCFSGVPMFCQVISDRNTEQTIDIFDMNWTLQEFTGFGSIYPHSKKQIPKPETFDAMKVAAETLSKDIPFSRIDLNEVQGKMYFGEITFFPASGMGAFAPNEWNRKLGDLICLPEKREI